MMSTSKYLITKLNGDNYFNWRYKIKMVLIEKGVWSVIEGDVPDPITTEWTKNDETAHSVIALNVEDDQIQYIRQCKLARDAWSKLKDVHEKDTANNRVYIQRQLMTQRLDEGGDVEAHVIKMNELFQKMTALGEVITQDFIFSATLLSSLPESYDNLITALEARDQELTLSIVCTKVIAEYKRRIERNWENNGESVLRVSSLSSFKKCTFLCHYCKEKGHIRKNCMKYTEWLKRCLKEQKDETPESEEAKKLSTQINSITTADAGNEYEEEFLFVAADSLRKWLLDSAATSHMAMELILFIEIDLNYRKRVTVADGSCVEAIGKGTIRMNFLKKSGGVANIVMENVLYIPELKGNFISIGKLTGSGYRVSFVDNYFEITLDDKEVAYGERSGNLYEIKTPNETM